MSTTLLVVVVLAAALACPVHMFWQMRSGKRAACCPSGRADELRELQGRQRALGGELARRAAEDGAAPDAGRVAGTRS